MCEHGRTDYDSCDAVPLLTTAAASLGGTLRLGPCSSFAARTTAVPSVPRWNGPVLPPKPSNIGRVAGGYFSPDIACVTWQRRVPASRLWTVGKSVVAGMYVKLLQFTVSNVPGMLSNWAKQPHVRSMRCLILPIPIKIPDTAGPRRCTGRSRQRGLKQSKGARIGKYSTAPG